MKDDEWRQQYQFLVAALIYSCAGRRSILGSLLHVPMERNSMPRAWERVIPTMTTTPALTDPRLGDLRGSMHLASASFRASTGAYRVLKSVDPNSALIRRDRDDWNRTSLFPQLKRTTSAPCCREEWHGSDPFAQWISIVVAHRDNFGHGERGARPDWQQQRYGLLARLNRCRVFEAQLRLIAWGLEKLEQRVQSHAAP